MEPVILDSARRHDVPDEDILHAYRNAITATDLDEGFTMLAGPDRAANLIEVGYVLADDASVVLIVHAMRPARPHFLR